MARKIVKEITTFDANEPTETVDNSVHNIEDTDGVQGYLAQFKGEQFRVKVYKQGPRGMEYCFSGGTEIDEDIIQGYGGGSYELRVFVNGVRQDTVPIIIAERPKTMLPNVSNASAPANNYDPDIAYMKRHMEFLEKMVMNGGVGNSGNSSMVELVEAVKALNGLSNGKDPMDMMLRGIELAKELNTGVSGDWKSALIDSFRDIAKSVAPVLVAKSQGMDMAQNNQESVSPEATIRNGIGYLKSRVVSGLHPDLVIDWILNNSNDPQYHPFLQMVFKSDFEEFIKIDSEIAQEPYLSWFRTLHAGLREAVNENLIADDSIRNSGNVRNIKGNEKPSKQRVAN